MLFLLAALSGSFFSASISTGVYLEIGSRIKLMLMHIRCISDNWHRADKIIHVFNTACGCTEKKMRISERNFSRELHLTFKTLKR